MKYSYVHPFLCKNIFIAPIDEYTKFKEARAHDTVINSTVGSDVMLFYEMNYYSTFSLAQFCFIPKGKYNLLFNYLDLNSSTCCVCKATNCEDCDHAGWTVSATENVVELTYSFVLSLIDISLFDYGAYTMIACIFQVDNNTCGLPALTEVEVYPSSNHHHVSIIWKKYGLKCILPSSIFVIIIVVALSIFCYCLCKG